MTSKKPLASSDSQADQQARTDAAADQQPAPEATPLDTLRAQLAESSEALAATQREAAGLQAQVDELKTANTASVDLVNTLNEDKNALLLQVSERDETIASLTKDKADLAEQVQAHTHAARGHTEDELHNLWCAAGGKLGDFEAAKRFVASL